MRGLAKTIALCALAGIPPAVAQEADEQALYPVPEESRPKAGVTYGEWVKAELAYTDMRGVNRDVFPGTTREIQAYVPDGWDGKTPACVCVMLDGAGFEMPTLVSNLIAAGELPMMFVVVVPPGRVTGARGDPDSARANRTFEYDTPSPTLGRFILDEVLPFVETLATRDGRKLLLSKRGNDRMIAGASSGAAAAFNAAWHFPEEFPRVFSAIGSYTGLRGAHEYPTLIHKTEAKPLRIFLQSGEQDIRTAFGDWWVANTAMARALEFAGYDFRHVSGTGGHSGAHATHLAPDAMRYLWKGWPHEPIAPAGPHRNHFLRELLIPDKPFELVMQTQTCQWMDKDLVSDGRGGVYVSISWAGRPCEGDGKCCFIDADGKIGTGIPGVLAVGADGSLLVMGKERNTLLYPDGDVGKGDPVICKDKEGRVICPHRAIPLRSGRFYVCGDAPRQNANDKELWLVNTDGSVLLPSSPWEFWKWSDCYALAADASGQWLYTFGGDRRGYSSRLEANDRRTCTQTFFSIHTPMNGYASIVRGAVCDRFGRTYLATACGVQVCDYNGRCVAILPLPEEKKESDSTVAAVAVAFGGKDMDILYVADIWGRIYARQLKTKGDSVLTEPAKIRVGAG